MTVHECDGPDGPIRWYSEGADDAPLTVMWHHGTPNVGEPPAPLLDVARDLGVRLIGLDRPGYGGTPRAEGRSVADIVPLATAVADAAGAEHFAVMGHSGGGPHAWATAAGLPGRVTAVATIAGLAPPSGLGLHWMEGMAGPGTKELTAALEGPDALRELIEKDEFDPDMFTEEDLEALQSDWAWFEGVAAAGVESGFDGFIDDDLAFVTPWGFEVKDVVCPALVVQGTADRIVPLAHGLWVAEQIAGAEYWEREGDGHITAMRAAGDALGWLTRRGLPL